MREHENASQVVVTLIISEFSLWSDGIFCGVFLCDYGVARRVFLMICVTIPMKAQMIDQMIDQTEGGNEAGALSHQLQSELPCRLKIWQVQRRLI